jgi:hypothetical protein
MIGGFMKRLFILLPMLIITLLAFYGCHRPGCKPCKASTEPEAQQIISNASDDILTYPVGFYFDATPTSGTCWYYDNMCVSTPAEANAYFDFINTSNARNYSVLSDRETDKYYERTWDKNPPLADRIFKCTYIGFDLQDLTMIYTLKTVTNSSVKEFAEFWMFHQYCLNEYHTYDTIRDILSSTMAEDTDSYISSITYTTYFNGGDWCMCETATAYEQITKVNKSTGVITWETPALLRYYYSGR